MLTPPLCFLVAGQSGFQLSFQVSHHLALIIELLFLDLKSLTKQADSFHEGVKKIRSRIVSGMRTTNLSASRDMAFLFFINRSSSNGGEDNDRGRAYLLGEAYR